MNVGRVTTCPGCARAFAESTQWPPFYCCRACAQRACERLQRARLQPIVTWQWPARKPWHSVRKTYEKPGPVQWVMLARHLPAAKPQQISVS